MTLTGGSTDEATLMAFGVKSNHEINTGQYWRFITPIFIHIGFIHLLFNSYALWIVGPGVEKLYGSARFVFLYVLTGVGGVIGSYYYNPTAISAGASGAIFGLFGVLLMFGLRYRHSIPPFFKKSVGAGVLPVIVINLIIGFTIPAIDNSAHLGGLIAGAALAGVVPYLRPGDRTPAIFKTVQVVFLVIIGLCFYMVAANYRGSPEAFINAANNAQNVFTESVRALESGNTADLPKTREDILQAIEQLHDAPLFDATQNDLTEGLRRVMEDQNELIQDVQSSQAVTFAHARRLKENVTKFGDLMERLSEWVKSEGEHYGIQMGNHP